MTNSYQAYYTSFHCSCAGLFWIALENLIFSYQAYYTSVTSLRAAQLWCLVWCKSDQAPELSVHLKVLRRLKDRMQRGRRLDEIKSTHWGPSA
ncbi:uncharacterized protein EAE98_005355 [Botrytis deweyae]|uniref:Transcription factor domain-containing protein n=1 Tax=Botrytis deweyae TaxID=2478750 RepID=A0ABQ7INP4_9HELO|nr:uncharacterized protein EAE98_005355 [Botrytis deweyae]KAF7929437.1 hypothetical protein EAE98_005355 [Botrytis deweyae]